MSFSLLAAFHCLNYQLGKLVARNASARASNVPCVTCLISRFQTRQNQAVCRGGHFSSIKKLDRMFLIVMTHEGGVRLKFNSL